MSLAPLASAMHTALMPRMSRFVAPGYPHHVTQRGVRSIRIFDGEDDRRLYLALMREQCDRFGVRFLAWCLMPNHPRVGRSAACT